jgi:hypothetical protein
MYFLFLGGRDDWICGKGAPNNKRSGSKGMMREKGRNSSELFWKHSRNTIIVQWTEENIGMGETAYPDIVVSYNSDNFFDSFGSFGNFLDNFNSAVRDVDTTTSHGPDRIPLAGHCARFAQSLLLLGGDHGVVGSFRELGDLRDSVGGLIRDRGRRIVDSIGHRE